MNMFGAYAVCRLGLLGHINGYKTSKKGEIIWLGYTPTGANWQSKRPLVLSTEEGKRRWDVIQEQNAAKAATRTYSLGGAVWDG